MDNLGDKDIENSFINWINIDDPNDHIQAQVIATIFDKRDMDENLEDSDEDTKNWKSHVPEWLYNYGNIFFKKKSECMPEWKLYDHPIDFVEGASLLKLAKICLLFSNEHNFLNE